MMTHLTDAIIFWANDDPFNRRIYVYYDIKFLGILTHIEIITISARGQIKMCPDN